MVVSSRAYAPGEVSRPRVPDACIERVPGNLDATVNRFRIPGAAVTARILGGTFPRETASADPRCIRDSKTQQENEMFSAARSTDRSSRAFTRARVRRTASALSTTVALGFLAGAPSASALIGRRIDDVIVNGTNGVDSMSVAGIAGVAASAKVTGLAAAVAVTGAEFANDRLDINTLAGADTVRSHLAPGVIPLFVDGVLR
jgi:hypothetical protein